MNPNDLFLRSHARAEGSQQPQHTHNTRGQASASNGASSSGVDQKPLDAQMMLDEASAAEGGAGEEPKSRRELEQERKDLELAQLLEMMDDYKPVVSLAPLHSLAGRLQPFGQAASVRVGRLVDSKIDLSSRTDPRRGDRLLPSTGRLRHERRPSVRP